MQRALFGFICALIIFSSCKSTDPNYKTKLDDPTRLHQSMKQLTDIIVYDIFSPPVASRIYAYASIGAFEVLALGDETINSLAGQLTDLQNLPNPEKEINHTVAALEAFNTIGKALIFSEAKMEEFQKAQDEELSNIQAPSGLIENSKAYGQTVASHILAWADKDNYKQTRSFPKYTIKEDDVTWKPTPPAYMEGIEPHWREIRPFVIKSPDQFTPPRPTEVDMKKDSPFYKELIEVYDAVKDATEETTAIASFWDCNPYVMNLKGHAMFATKKITPGGHWIGITAIACRKDSANISKTAKAYALTSIALADAFISCWDEKYRSNLIRPETIINQHIDENWMPILQTPPFPEYTSGHSVISSAAAIALSSIFGDNFQFDDDVEVEYGLPVRSFNSFIEASEEAAISRLYGGIHYRPAIDNGVTQGRALGKYVVENLAL